LKIRPKKGPLHIDETFIIGGKQPNKLEMINLYSDKPRADSRYSPKKGHYGSE